jgi:hypothetical protein
LRAAAEVTNRYLAKFGDTISCESKAGILELSEYVMKELSMRPRVRSDPKSRKRNQALMTRLNADPVFAERRNASNSERFTRLNRDPDFKAKQIAGLQRYWNERANRKRLITKSL